MKKRRSTGKKRKIDPRAKLELELDKAWSGYILSRDRYCQICGGHGKLSAHHAFGRRHMATRWDVENGVLLCLPHHLYWAHRDPSGFTEWFKTHVGLEHYERLAEVHRRIEKHTMEDLQSMLENIRSLE